MFSIIISEKGGAERRETFDKNEINVGRVQGNDLMLPKGNVSKHHARLLFRDGRFIVTDLKSTNGTYVNGRKIAQATIVREGDKIYIGDFVLRLDSGAAPVAADSDHIERRTRPRARSIAGSASARPCRHARRRGPCAAARAVAPAVAVSAAAAGRSRLRARRCRRRRPGRRTARAAAARSDPNAVSHYPLERDPDESESVPARFRGQARRRVPGAPRVPGGMPPIPPLQASGSHCGRDRRHDAAAAAAAVLAAGVERAPAAAAPEAAPRRRQPVRSSMPPAGVAAGAAGDAARRPRAGSRSSRWSIASPTSSIWRPSRSSPLVDEQLSQPSIARSASRRRSMRDEGEAPEGIDVEMLVRDALRELVGLGPIGPLLEDDEVLGDPLPRVTTKCSRCAAATPSLADASFTSEDALGRDDRAPRPADGRAVACRRARPRAAPRARARTWSAIAPPAASGYVLVIRKRRRVEMTLEDLVRAGALSRAMATFVESCLVGAREHPRQRRRGLGYRRAARRRSPRPGRRANASASCRSSTRSA